MRLTAEIAKHFGEMKASVKALTEECDTLAKDIKDEMVARTIDEFAPKASPFKLVKTEFDQQDVSYKEFAEEAYREFYGKTWKAKWDRAISACGKKHVVKLESKPNENWVEEKAS